MVVTRNSCKVYQRKGKSLSKQKGPDEIISDVLTQVNADNVDQGERLINQCQEPSSEQPEQEVRAVNIDQGASLINPSREPTPVHEQQVNDNIDQDAPATTSIFPSSINKQQQIVIQRGKRKTNNKEVASTSVIPPNITKQQRGKGKTFNKEVASTSIIPPNITKQRGKGKTLNKEVASTSVIPPNITERVQLHMLSSPASIVLLCDNLNDKQKSEVKDIGFGGLLHLNIRKSYHGMAKYFIDQYDVTTSIFIVNANCKFTVSQYDICDIFGLPLTDNYIVESLKSRENNSNDQLIEEWKEKLDCIGQKEIPAEKLFSKMVGVLKEGGDDFKRFFVMYAMITFLAPTSHKTVDYTLVKALDDVNQIRNLNWSGLVFERFKSGLERCQTRKLKNIPSCLTILELCFFHRFGVMGDFASSSLPLIQHWSYELLKERAKRELKARSIGLGDFDAQTYPVSKKMVNRNQAKTQNDEQFGDIELEENGKFLRIPIPHGCLTTSDKTIREMAGNDELLEEVTKMKRNIEIVTQHHMGRLLKMKAKGNTNENVGTSSSSPTLSQFYADPNVLKEIDDIVGRIKEVRKRAADIGQPSFDLGISDIDTTPPPPPQRAPKPIRAKRARK